MISDNDIKQNVENELRWNPDIDATDIVVAVKNGVGTLTGFVRSYSHKIQAEQDAKRVAGVVGVANNIDVRVPSVDERSDSEIGYEAAAVITSQLSYSAQNIKVMVDNGWITLEGEIVWNSQREKAEEIVRSLRGVKGVINSIQVKPTVTPSEVKRKIEEAFKRNAAVDANRIVVEASDGEVVLKGTVRSWSERQEAERAAWAAPGVKKVVDQLTIGA